MGSNPILAAIYQRKCGDWAPVACRPGGALVLYALWFLPFFYHQHASLHRSSPDQSGPTCQITVACGARKLGFAP
jgi:hypothetical protein